MYLYGVSTRQNIKEISEILHKTTKTVNNYLNSASKKISIYLREE